MDPFFRARVNSMQFAARLGQINYLQFELPKQAITIQETRAKVSIKVTFEAKQFQLGTEMKSIPPTEQVFEEEWVWVDEDWYKIYKTQSSDLLPQI